MKNAPHFFWLMGLMKILERFAFQGMRAILILFLMSDLEFIPADAYEIYGAVMALYYGFAVIGGWWADRYLGTVNAVVIGSVFMALGYLGLTFSTNYNLLIISLSFFVVGSLFYKTTGIVLFGFNFRDALDRRDRGFEYLFYFMNIGTVLGVLLCGYIGQKFGWRYGFGLAAFAIIVRLFIVFKYYDRFKRIFHDYAKHKWVYFYTLLIGGGGFGFCAYILFNPFILDFCLPIFIVLIFSYLIYLMSGFNKEERIQSSKMVVVFFLTIVFFVFYELKASGLSVYLQYDVNRAWNNFIIPTTWFQAISTIVIVLSGFTFINLLNRIKIQGQPIKVYYRYLSGLIVMGVGYFVVFIGHSTAMFMGYKIGFSWFIIAYIFMSFSELLVFPIMHSSATKLAPKNHVNFFAGLVSFSGLISNYLAAELAKISTPLNATPDNLVSPVGFLSLLFIIVAILTIIPILMIIFRKKFSF